MALGPVLLAGVGVIGSVGANVLADVVTGVVDRLRGDGKEITQAPVEKALALKLEEALVGQRDSANRTDRERSETQRRRALAARAAVAAPQDGSAATYG